MPPSLRTSPRSTGTCWAETAPWWTPHGEKYLKADSVRYAVSFNGKTRFTLDLAADMDRAEVEKTALAAPEAAKWIDGKTPRKVIVVPGKIVNIVL